MTDTYFDPINHDEFYGPFAHEMVRSGRCAKRNCPHYRHDGIFMISEKGCRECYKSWKENRR